MKAIVNEQYGSPDVLRMVDLAKPAPTDDQVLVKIFAVSLNGSDREGLVGKPLYARIGGLTRPGNPILGSDIAGRVEAVGKNVAEFKPGDAVFGESPGYHGGLAEYVCASPKLLAHKPAALSFAQASTIPQAGVIALQGMREKGPEKSGQQVLINGAGGGAGMFAVQLARMYGAVVTGVDNVGKLDFVRSLGAEHVIDYAREDFTRNGKEYDLILDVIGHRSASDYERALAANGSYLYVGGGVGTLLQLLILGPFIKRRSGKTVRLLAVDQNRKDLLAITELVSSGKIAAVIDREYPLNEAADALRYVSEGRVKGKVVIRVAEG